MKYMDLHIHTEYSLGNGITKIPELVKKAHEYGMDTVAITDSGSIGGFGEFARECSKLNIKPIFGCGFYFAPLGHNTPETHHLVLLAKNIVGYKNLVNLFNFSLLKKFSGKPRISYSELEEYSEGIIALSGGLGGIFDKPFLNKNMDLATSNVDKLKKIFASDFYFEIQDNGLKKNRDMMEIIKNYSGKVSVQVVFTGGSFYLNRDDAANCNDIRIKNNNKELVGDGYNFKSLTEILNISKEYCFALENCVEISEKIESFQLL